jgi:hypothetical protein
VGYSQAGFLIGSFFPEDTHKKRLGLLRFFLGITFVLGLLAIIDQRQYADEIAVWAVSSKWRWAIRFGWVLVSVVGLSFISTWTSLQRNWFKFIELGVNLTGRFGIFRPIAVVTLALVFPVLVFGPYGRYVLPFFTRLLIFWLFVNTGTWLSESYWSYGNPICVSVAIALIYGSVQRLALFSLDVSAYPFSLGWSEASRYYYASLFFSEQIYGVSIPPSVLHPTRYLLQSIPFLLPGAGLVAHRLWQVIIWVVMTASVGVVLVRRLRLESHWMRLLLAIWVFLFLFQGPVWYHLLVMVFLILWGTRTERPWWTLAVVLLASLWAGISRVNWIPVPGMLAALLYYLERKTEEKRLLKYSMWPAIWFIGGLASGFISQWLYILISGNEAGRFGSSFISPLLWYRLMPSSTYPLGVLPGIVLASLPLLLLIGYRLKDGAWRSHVFRLSSIAAILVVLFGGGILVSLKIGGGSNLHNLDAFLVALMILGLYAVMGRWQLAPMNSGGEKSNPLLLVMLAIWMPISFTVGIGKPLRSYDMDQAQESLTKIQSIVSAVSSAGGEVLFISQRHLLTLDVIEDVDMIPEYETVFLMEMAMSRNRTYLDQFHKDLENHRFDLIVVDQLSTQIQDRGHNFAEENNAWVEEISYPILCHYVAVETLPDPPLQFFVPSDAQTSCTS